jgi:hypothetical protein
MNNHKEKRPTAAKPAELAGRDSPRTAFDHLLALQLEDSLYKNHFGLDLRTKVAGGGADLYNRFKVRDAAESLQVIAIVALYNAVLGAYREAARWDKDREQILVRAFEGTSKLVELIDAFEVRRDRKRREEPELRQRFLQSITDRLEKEV